MKRFEYGLNLIVVASAAAAVILLIRDRGNSQGRQADLGLSYVYEWQQIVQSGIVLENPTAPITLAVFSDFQCPSCRRFDAVSQSVALRYKGAVSRVFVHFPLQQIHLNAFAAARAAECADAQNRFRPIHDLLYANQDSLTEGRWRILARQAGVGDLDEFDRCMQHDVLKPRIDSGIVLARRLGLRGTPTVFANGWQFESPPNERQLIHVIDALIAGRKPRVPPGG